MIKRQKLLRVCVPNTITVEILGPAPPKRVDTFSSTKARIIAKSFNNAKVEISQGENVLLEFQSGCEPFLFEETTYEFIIEILDKEAQ